MDTLQQLPAHGDGLLDMRELRARSWRQWRTRSWTHRRTWPARTGPPHATATASEDWPPPGDIALRIPKLRAGTHFPKGLIERYPRTDRAAAAAVAESWADGVSTRKMERIARELV